MARDDEMKDLYLAIREAQTKSAEAMAASAEAMKMIELHAVYCVGRQKINDLQLKIIMGLLGVFATAGMTVAVALATKWATG